MSEVIIKLHETREDFDTDTKEAKAFNKLVASLCSQYEIMMTDESKEATLLFKPMTRTDFVCSWPGMQDRVNRIRTFIGL